MSTDIVNGEEIARPKHPNKAVEEAVQAMEAAGWRIEMSRGHIWAKAKCPAFTPDGCIVHIHSTPKKPENHAKRLRRQIEACGHAH